MTRPAPPSAWRCFPDAPRARREHAPNGPDTGGNIARMHQAAEHRRAMGIPRTTAWRYVHPRRDLHYHPQHATGELASTGNFPRRRYKKMCVFCVLFALFGTRLNDLKARFCCCAVHPKYDLKPHPTARTALLVGSSPLAAGRRLARLSTNNPPTPDVSSLHNTRQGSSPWV